MWLSLCCGTESGVGCLEFGALQTDIPRVDAAQEGYGAYLEAVGGDAKRQLDLKHLPPSFGRGLKHLDCAVEARCLPNPRPLILLGASVRGLPVSEAPVLEVCSTSNNWSSESDEMAVEWDGDEAFYWLDNNRRRPLRVAGRLCGRRQIRGTIQGRWWCWASANCQVCGLLRLPL